MFYFREFTISGRPIGLAADHGYLCFEAKDGCTRDVYDKESWLANYQLTREPIDVYSCGAYNGMKFPKDCQIRCMKQPLVPFLAHWPIPPNLVESYKIIGMMRNIVIQRDAWSVK